MISEKEIVDRFADLRHETLSVWIKRGWVTPERGQIGYRFSEVDTARVGLIYEFSTDLEFDEDMLDVVLPLLDQVHGLRDQLRRLADAVHAQPDDVRERIARAMENSKG
jgi:chaperone modulatory protein CbpM